MSTPKPLMPGRVERIGDEAYLSYVRSYCFHILSDNSELSKVRVSVLELPDGQALFR
jgi:hypothetical protein